MRLPQRVCGTLFIGVIGMMSAAPVRSASAQYAGGCLLGYAYSYGYGCVPTGGAYQSFYGGPSYGGLPPIYEPFAFGFGGGGFGGGGFGGGGFGGGGYRGGGFRGGGFHGGGAHGGGGHFGGGGHGGGGGHR